LNPKTLLIVVATLALLGVGFLFFQGPKPIIEIKAEKITDLGPFPLVNTFVTSFFVMLTLVFVAWLVSRKVTLIPSRLQNMIEAVIDAFYTICVNTAGEKNGRRFFPVVMTIFTFIWIANWMALLPFFNAIGKVQEVSAHHWHEEAIVFQESGISFINPGEKEIEFEPDESEVAAISDEIAEAKAEGADAHTLEELEERKHHAEEEARAAAIVHGLHEEGLITDEIAEMADPLAAEEEALHALEEDGKRLGILIPFFRSMNTDINSPLSIALWAMIFIEFWGITGLGLFKYGSKFINFSSPINFFVGILEFIAEMARIISFTFRLFGNMLAGEILLLVMTFLVPFIVAVPFYALEVFVGLIQAFVFAMLTLVFGVLAVSSHEGHDEPGGHDDPDRPMEGPVPVMHA
jgi:F-type H+-transporting ATPase subunit a